MPEAPSESSPVVQTTAPAPSAGAPEAAPTAAVRLGTGIGGWGGALIISLAAMLGEGGIEPVLQLTCRDRNRIALQSDLLSAAASGVRNLLMLRGDDPSAGDPPDAQPVFDRDPRSLLQTARRLRDTGELPS